MSLLLDIFGYLTVLLRGATLVAQSVALGGIAFSLLLAEPLAARHGEAGVVALERSRRLTAWSGCALALLVAVSLGGQTAVLAGSTGLTTLDALRAESAIADFVQFFGAIGIVAICLVRPAPRHRSLLLLAGMLLLGSAATSHAASRLEDRALLFGLMILHQAAVAVWIGGIPHFLLALGRAGGPEAVRWIGRRFSRMSMVSVAALLAAGIGMSLVYIDAPQALYGTAYGIMVLVKVALFVCLLGLGAMNFRNVERLRRDPATPILRLRRFAEAEIGIGFTVIFAAASLTSVPPAIDLQQDRVTFAEIVERTVPHWPRFESPERSSLAIRALQDQLSATAGEEAAAQAYVPGAGILPPRNAFDVAWSEYNHHWAGFVVLAIGLLALAERTGRAPWARHWPLLFLVLAGFLFLRSDVEAWPHGDIGFFESFRDPEVVQHRMFVLLIAAFAFFEWGVRTGRVQATGAALVFPLASAVAGALLLTHSHTLGNVKELLLVEMTHAPLALFGVTAGWARWLELRTDPPESRVAAWIWPACFTFVGLILVLYREA